MTTALSVARVELSKQLNDDWVSTSTGAGSVTTIVDALLKAKQNAWIGKDMYDLITESGHASVDEERQISSLVGSTGILTVLAHDNTTGTSMDYEVHRLFTASEKRIALIAAARMAYPDIHEKIWDESLVSGNWFKDGSFEIWTSSSALTYWTTTTSTITKTTSSPYYKHGATSCKISTAAGTVKQSISNWDDLKRLAGHTVTFSIQAWCDTASCLRVSINDGVNSQTYSSYHTGDSAWTNDDPRVDSMYAQQFIDWNATEITLTIHHEIAAATSYVDDARAIGPYQPRLFIDQLGLAQEKPVQVEIEPYNYSTDEPWSIVFNSRLDTELGYIYLPSSVQRDRRLRIKGIGYLDFLVSGASSTDWAATININSPQTDILIAQAIVYLYTRKSLPNFSRSTNEDFQNTVNYWERELKKRIGKFGMEIPSIPSRFQ
ncbi:hypothetical protein LCGC14_0387780 [marine sediment metagenome]|uniref:Uncharacterized protein n=1 Tax=marine sediment metagenome TaxID=412755 RepID=A0A0F9VMM0_9ZZZZ